MKNQLFISSKEYNSNVIVTGIDANDSGRKGGLWTSSFVEGIGSNWLVGEKVVEEFLVYQKGFLFSVEDTARILHIKNEEDEKIFKELYKGVFSSITQDYDAVHLELNYINEIKRNHKFSLFLDWSTESTWWFNVNHLELIKVFSGEELLKMRTNSKN